MTTTVSTLLARQCNVSQMVVMSLPRVPPLQVAEHGLQGAGRDLELVQAAVVLQQVVACRRTMGADSGEGYPEIQALSDLKYGRKIIEVHRYLEI